MTTLMGIVADRNKLDIAGTKVHVVKEMVQEPVRRIGTLRVTIGVPAEKGARLTAEDRKKLETAALHCPVHKSLHPDIQTPIEFSYS
jgi:putative redox protein